MFNSIFNLVLQYEPKQPINYLHQIHVCIWVSSKSQEDNESMYLLVVGIFQLVVGNCELVVGNCELVVGNCPLVVGNCPLVVGNCPLVVGNCRLLTVVVGCCR
jgi:hypothetical protein